MFRLNSVFGLGAEHPADIADASDIAAPTTLVVDGVAGTTSAGLVVTFPAHPARFDGLAPRRVAGSAMGLSRRPPAGPATSPAATRLPRPAVLRAKCIVAGVAGGSAPGGGALGTSAAPERRDHARPHRNTGTSLLLNNKDPCQSNFPSRNLSLF